MHSSTSNSDARILDGPWCRTGILALSLALVTLGGWEGFWRSHGFEPGLRDDKQLWAHARREVVPNDPDEIVLIGASRMQIDIDLDVMKKVLGRRPVQLAMDGCSCVPILDHLSRCEDFVGTVVMDIWPTAIYKYDTAPTATRDAIDYYEGSTFSRSFEDRLALEAQRSFVFRLPDLAYAQLRGAYRRGEWPKPYFTRLFLDRYRQADFTKAKTHNLLMCVPPEKPAKGDPKSKTPGQWLEFVGQIEEMIKRLQDRGGQVVICYIPSSGATRQWEEEMWPRQKYWDVLSQNTSAISIHPDDYVSLDGFNCPDGSHLDFRAAPAFTEAFARILKQRLAGITPDDYVSPKDRRTRINYAKTAEILESPKFIDVYKFESALRGEPAVLVSWAEDFNPVTIILDIGDEAEPVMLETAEYAWPGSQWYYQDYAWHVSSDRTNWRCVFDSRHDTNRRRWSRAPDNSCFDLRGVGSWRFVRLTLRESLLDNRLLMRRLFIWGQYQHLDLLKTAPPLPLVEPPASTEAPIDLAAGATVMGGPLFRQGHDLSLALRGREDLRFAEAAEAGPTSVVIDLGWTIEAGTIEWTKVASTDAPGGYRWELSTDGESWTEVFDSAKADWSNTADALKQHCSLSDKRAFRFLRLTARLAPDEPLRLRRIAVFR